MKAALDCIPCIQRQALEAARMATADSNAHKRIVREAMKALLAIDWDLPPPDISRVVHGIVCEISGNEDPYREVKGRYNDVALGMYPKIRELVANSADPMGTALRLAIAGNVIDFAVSSEFDLDGAIEAALTRGFTIDNSTTFLDKLEKSRRILYLSDNAGEIVFDKLLLETILSRYGQKDVVLVVKSAPIINDATLEDALYVGMDKIPGIEFLGVGPGLERTSSAFRQIIEKSDLTISKGQGNYEALSDVKGIFFLFMAKCAVLARTLDVKKGSIVLWRS